VSYSTTSTQIAPGRLEATDTGAPATAPCPICGSTQPQVAIQKSESGEWKTILCGHFELTWCVTITVALRLLLIFLRSLRTPSSTAARPFLRQEWLATCFGVYQEHISRWEKCWRENHWHILLSEHLPTVLTAELRAKVLATWVPNFWLSAPQVQERLQATGTTVSRDQIEEVAQQSGFAQVRRLLRQLAPFKDSGFQLGQAWLVRRLFALLDDLHGRLQRGEALPTQTIVEVQTLRQLAGPAGQPQPVVVPPWQARIDQWLTSTWEAAPQEEVRCPHCHSSKVGRKSGQPRYKTYWGADGQKHQVAVYRYYCKNPKCPCKTFTNLPWGLLPHTPFGLLARLLALGVYLGYRTTYRRAAWALGLTGSTVYRWVHFWAQHPTLLALLLGQVRSSGVVAIDEKWVKVRPAQPTQPHAHAVWMYAYFAVDVYTHDLLHILLSPVNDERAAQVFLLELRAKGYHPKVIVTDLRQDYGRVIQAVFPQAIHHECIFHALQNTQRQVQEVYGKNYQDIPEAVALKEAIYSIFKAQSQKTVRQRYHQVMALRQTYMAKMPGTAAIFDSLERHFPKLVNAIESDLIPRTNNAVELVIRRFDQHYQNFCGFDGEESGQEFLQVFQLAYRLTPFAKDNREVQSRGYSIRSKCPLELAGYDLSQLPLAQLFQHPLLTLPGQPDQEVVPIR
jgi:transposase-like protein